MNMLSPPPVSLPNRRFILPPAPAVSGAAFCKLANALDAAGALAREGQRPARPLPDTPAELGSAANAKQLQRFVEWAEARGVCREELFDPDRINTARTPAEREEATLDAMNALLHVAKKARRKKKIPVPPVVEKEHRRAKMRRRRFKPTEPIDRAVARVACHFPPPIKRTGRGKYTIGIDKRDNYVRLFPRHVSFVGF